MRKAFHLKKSLTHKKDPYDFNNKRIASITKASKVNWQAIGTKMVKMDDYYLLEISPNSVVNIILTVNFEKQACPSFIPNKLSYLRIDAVEELIWNTISYHSKSPNKTISEYHHPSNILAFRQGVKNNLSYNVNASRMIDYLDDSCHHYTQAVEHPSIVARRNALKLLKLLPPSRM